MGKVKQRWVLDGAPRLPEEIFGDSGYYARVAVGVEGTTLGSAVELGILAR